MAVLHCRYCSSPQAKRSRAQGRNRRRQCQPGPKSLALGGRKQSGDLCQRSGKKPNFLLALSHWQETLVWSQMCPSCQGCQVFVQPVRTCPFCSKSRLSWLTWLPEPALKAEPLTIATRDISAVANRPGCGAEQAAPVLVRCSRKLPLFVTVQLPPPH
jgi:hypothetical protein